MPDEKPDRDAPNSGYTKTAANRGANFLSLTALILATRTRPSEGVAVSLNSLLWTKACSSLLNP